MIIGVDLAARHSAVIGMDTSGEVVFQYDSSYETPDSFVEKIVTSAGLSIVELVMVEDMPYRVPYTESVKLACRIQGMIIQKFLDLGLIDKLIFCQPSLWLNYFREQSWKVKSKAAKLKAMAQTAHDLGYDAPDLHTHLHGKERTLARKAETDYVAAFLIAKWTTDMINDGVDFSTINSTERYEVQRGEEH